MWPSTRRRKKDSTSTLPQQRCFYCNQTSLILPRSLAHDIYNGDASESPASSSTPQASTSTHVSLGDVDDWTCAQCDCRNVRSEEEPHEVASWQDAMAGDAAGLAFAQIPTSRSLTRIASEAELAVEEASHPPHLFCRRCATNQQIQLTLLADFDPASTSEQVPSLAAYRADLDARYPLVCDDCRPVVEAEIERRNDLARRDIWRARMERSPPSRKVSVAGTRKRVVSGARPLSGTRAEELPNPVEGPRRPSIPLEILRILVLIYSAVVSATRTGKALFAPEPLSWCTLQLCNAVTSSTWLPLAFVNAILGHVELRKSRTVARISQDPDEILDTEWEPREKSVQDDTYPRRFLARVHVLSAIVLCVSGAVQSDWLDTGYTRRFAITTSLLDWIEGHRLVVACVLLATIVQLICICIAVYEIVIATVVLRSSRHPKSSTTIPTKASATTFNSLERTALDTFFKPSASTAQDDTPMDWQPTVPPDSTTHAALAPQRFYPPEVSTGLESLLDRGLTLRDDVERPREQRTTQSNVVFILGLLSGMVLALGLVLALFFAQDRGMRTQGLKSPWAGL